MYGKFALGMAAGIVAAAAIGYALSDSRSRDAMMKSGKKAVKNANRKVNHIAGDVCDFF